MEKNAWPTASGNSISQCEMDLEDRQSLKSSQQIFDQAALQELALDAAVHLAENQLGKAAVETDSATEWH